MNQGKIALRNTMQTRTFQLESFVGSLTGRSESLLTPDLKTTTSNSPHPFKENVFWFWAVPVRLGPLSSRRSLRMDPGIDGFDINENGLTELVRDLRSTPGLRLPDDFRFYPMNLGDQAFRKLFLKSERFNIVANFAAHKHVRSEKDRYSIEAMIDNNVVRAKNFLELLNLKRPEHFFCVSTDKATRPVNIMGASKSLMEKMIFCYANAFPVTTARFANVAFSNGSLLDGFLYRLAKGQPFSAPSDVKRYFVSPVESGQICMLACLLANTAEICFPKLDLKRDLLTFSEIAERFLDSMGLVPLHCKSEEEARQRAKTRKPNDREYPVYFFESDTSGEKPFEEFYTENEDLDWSVLNRLASLGM